jgi:hypothetical protein
MALLSVFLLVFRLLIRILLQWVLAVFDKKYLHLKSILFFKYEVILLVFIC